MEAFVCVPGSRITMCKTFAQSKSILLKKCSFTANNLVTVVSRNYRVEPLRRVILPVSVASQRMTYNEHEAASFASDSSPVDDNSSFSMEDESISTLSVSDLEVGRTYEGIVKNITNYGAFVDIGASKYGLLHISQMSDRFVSDPNEIVSVGSQVEVRVLKVDEEKDQFSLTMRKGEQQRRKRKEEPEHIVEALRSFAEQVDRRNFTTGRVVNVTDFGAFVDIKGPKDGLVFRADMTDELEVDDEIQVRVKRIDLSRKFITLSMKPFTEYEGNMPFVKD